MRLKLFLFVAIIAGITTVQSQEYLEMIDDGSYPVQEIIDNAEAYFADKDKGRGSGYVQFKRWEYQALRTMNEDGYLRSITEDIAELERFNAYLNNTAGTRQQLNDNWQELGPTDWNATTSWNPGVGRITGISVDETNTDHIIVGANTGGVWRTTDAGQTWTPLTDEFSSLYVYSVRIDPSNSSVFYFGSLSGQIFKSTDSGATWNLLADVGSQAVNKILVHPTDSSIMFASGGGLFKSTDAGATWTNAVSSGSGYDFEFKPGDPSVVYASGNGFFKSTDGGATFSSIGGFSSGPKMIGVSADDATVVYVVEASGGGFNGFYESSDSGSSFTQLNHAGRNYFGYDTAGFNPGGQAPRDMDITVNPNDVDEVHIAGILTWRSTNGGVDFTCTADWVPGSAQAANIGYCHADVDIMEFIGTTLYVGTDGGIFIAEDTATIDSDYYEDITTGIGIRQFYKIGVNDETDVTMTGGSQDNGSSAYTAAGGWIDWIGADGMEGFVDKDNPLVMYGMIQFGAMYRTNNGGLVLIDMSEPGSGSGEWVTPFEQDPTETNTVYVGYNRVYKGTNFGTVWTPISQAFSGNLDNLKIAPSNNQIMYASNGAQMFKTEDGGTTNWVTITSPNGGINSIAIHPTNPQKVAVATTSSNKVMVSDDGGTTWQPYLFNLPAFSALSVVWDDNGVDGLYLGMDYGIYYIDNTFTEWQPYSNNLPNVRVGELEINNGTNMLYCGSYGRGLWVTPLVDDVLSVTDRFTESSINIYPNPASSELTISMLETTETDIRVYDLLGKLVIYEANVLVSNRHTLNVSALLSGTYFVRMNSEFGTVTKKFIKK